MCCSMCQSLFKWTVIICPNMCYSLLYFQDIPGCGKFRKHPLQNEDELAICFRGIVNIGSDHWNPCANTSTMAVDEEAAVSRHASDTSTFEASFVTMDAFRDSLATSIALAWN